jgi:hypothetical protein
MKTTTRSNIYLAMLVMILTVALAVAAAAAQQVPFKGALQGNDTDTCFSFPIVCVRTDGTGTGTHLGNFSFTLENTVNLVTGTSTGIAHFVAANGDAFDATVSGSGVLLTPDLISITEIYTITGGTGRFAGAQGTFTVERLASPVTFMTAGSFDGSITSPGAANQEADED